MKFTCKVEDGAMRCTIIADRELKAPVLSCSGMQPLTCLSGGTVVMTLGSTIEVALPDLAPGVPQDVVLRYDDDRHHPVNRAWLPLGPYLRHAGGSIALPPLPSGVDPVTWPAPGPVEGLRLIPAPSRWAPAGGLRHISSIAGDDPALRAWPAAGRQRSAGGLA